MQFHLIGIMGKDKMTNYKQGDLIQRFQNGKKVVAKILENAGSYHEGQKYRVEIIDSESNVYAYRTGKVVMWWDKYFAPFDGYWPNMSNTNVEIPTMKKQRRWEFVSKQLSNINYELIEKELSYVDPIAFVEHNDTLLVFIHIYLWDKSRSIINADTNFIKTLKTETDLNNSIVCRVNLQYTPMDKNNFRKVFINWAKHIKNAPWPNKGVTKVMLPRI